MKRFILITLTLANSVFAADSSLAEHLQKGLFEEEANHNLQAAISEYTQIIEEADRQRRIIATALTRLAECYRKLGKEEEAQKVSDRLAREFPEVQPPGYQQRLNSIVSSASTPDAQDPGHWERMRLALNAELDYYRSYLEQLEANANKGLPGDPQQTNGATPAEIRKVITDVQSQLAGVERHIKASAASGLSPEEADQYAKLSKRLEILRQQEFELLGTYSEDSSRVQQVRKLIAAVEKELSAYPNMLQRALQQAELDLQQLLAKYTPRHPVVLAKQKEIAQLRERLARNSSFPDLARLLENSPDLLNAPATNNVTFLQHAAAQGNVELMRFLLERGARTDRASQAQEYPPLFVAVMAGHKKAAELLIEAGADVNYRSVRGVTALQLAAERGYTEMTELLLSKGAEVNAPAHEGGTALYWAAYYGHAGEVRFLLQHGAEVDAAPAWGQIPLLAAVSQNHPAAAKALIEGGAEVNSTNNPPIVRAVVQTQSPEMVSLLLENGANPNVHFSGTTPLIGATRRNQPQLVRLLVEKGADVNAQDATGDTPLHWAMTPTVAPEIAEFLLDQGADPNIQNNRGRTPLFYASGSPTEDSSSTGAPTPGKMRLLLGHGANPNVADKVGNLPIDFPIQANSFEPAEMLFKAGARAPKYIKVQMTEEIAKLVSEYASKNGATEKKEKTDE